MGERLRGARGKCLRLRIGGGGRGLEKGKGGSVMLRWGIKIGCNICIKHLSYISLYTCSILIFYFDICIRGCVGTISLIGKKY